jgi:anti-sigma B factor antagonist
MRDSCARPAMAPPRPPFALIEHPLPEGGVRLALHGEMDLATVPGLQERLEGLRAARTPVVIDLREVTFIDSTGIRCLLLAGTDASRDGWQVEVIQGPKQVRETLEVAGIVQRLPFVDAPPE